MAAGRADGRLFWGIFTFSVAVPLKQVPIICYWEGILQWNRYIRIGEVKMYYCISAAECLEVLKNDPEMDGLQLLDIVTKQYPQFVTCMVRAYHSTKYSDEANKKGAKGFFAIPVDFNSLKDCIQKTYAEVSR